jgi:hypothetical protein
MKLLVLKAYCSWSNVPGNTLWWSYDFFAFLAFKYLLCCPPKGDLKFFNEQSAYSFSFALSGVCCEDWAEDNLGLKMVYGLA